MQILAIMTIRAWPLRKEVKVSKGAQFGFCAIVSIVNNIA
jgi:hypothetical protein